MATNLQVYVGHNFEPGGGPAFGGYPVGIPQLDETSRRAARAAAGLPVGWPCLTPAAPGGVEEPSGSGRSPAAALDAAIEVQVHDWSPWSLLAFTGTRESLEQRVCHVCGQDEVVASDCLGGEPQRMAMPADVGIVSIAPVDPLLVAPR